MRKRERKIVILETLLELFAQIERGDANRPLLAEQISIIVRQRFVHVLFLLALNLPITAR